MVAEKHSRLVPASYLEGASCLLPAFAGLRRGKPEETGDRLAGLTPAERVVVGLVCEGMSNKEIAAALNRAEATIKHQLSTAMGKLGARSRCQLIVRLLRG